MVFLAADAATITENDRITACCTMHYTRVSVQICTHAVKMCALKRYMTSLFSYNWESQFLDFALALGTAMKLQHMYN